jgi:Tfp pilus assembly protein PilN
MTIRPLYLDFVRRRRHRDLLGPALLAAALLAGAALVAWFTVLDRAAESAARLESALSRRGAAAALPVARLSAEEEKRMAATLRQLTTPWEELLEGVEQAASDDVAVLALEQDAARSSLKLTAEARNPASMLAYLRRIEAARALRSATLETHKIELQQPGQPVRFSITARYAALP